MAEALFNAYCHPDCAHAISAGSEPAEQIDPQVVAAMRELDIDVSAQRPKRLSQEMVREVQWVITMGCGDDPALSGVRVEDWPLDDPHGVSLDEVRRIRDQIADRVWRLVVKQGWVRLSPRALNSRSLER
jgi:arsenate reductase